jgi:hypothetical protein
VYLLLPILEMLLCGEDKELRNNVSVVGLLPTILMKLGDIQ